MKCTPLEKLEILAIGVLLPVTWSATSQIECEFPFGQMVGLIAALLLGQSLLRDVVLWFRGRKSQTEKRRIGCLCAESTIGLTLALTAVGLSLLGITQVVTLSPAQCTATVAAVLLAGFFSKDFIVIIRKEKDHGSIRVW